eukprot:713909-Prorocentrum_minimum.AAC.2
MEEWALIDLLRRLKRAHWPFLWPKEQVRDTSVTPCALPGPQSGYSSIGQDPDPANLEQLSANFLRLAADFRRISADLDDAFRGLAAAFWGQVSSAGGFLAACEAELSSSSEYAKSTNKNRRKNIRRAVLASEMLLE